MPQGRIIASSISTSKKLSKVSVFSCLLFTWLIPQCDDFGHMDGDADLVKGIVVPLVKNKTAEDVEEALKELEEAQLIKRYRVEKSDDVYLEIIGWETFQSSTWRKNPAKYPIPDWTKPLSDTSTAKLSLDTHNNTIHNNTIQYNTLRVPISANSSKVNANSDRTTANEEVEQVFTIYKKLIQPTARLTAPSAKQIHTRLSNFKVLDLLLAVENFSKNGWWMEHNSDKGMAWFFSSDRRVDMFLSLRPEKNTNNTLEL